MTEIAMKPGYRVRMFCPLNFYRGTVEPAPKGYGINLVSSTFTHRREAENEELRLRSLIKSESWQFSIEEVCAAYETKRLAQGEASNDDA